jgi:hypothetical protein
MAQDKPYVWQMVREAVKALGGSTTNKAVRDWILAKYPGTNPTTIGCQIIVCTVNHASRIHYPENKKPRLANTQYDFLFRPEKGRLDWYYPTKHGQWAIVERDDGTLGVALADDGPEAGTGDDPSDTGGHAFAAEAHLRDYLAQHLSDIESGLQLYVEEEGIDGIEYVTDIGRIDILAVDKDGQFVVIELKVGRGPDAVCGQLMRYVGWVKIHLAHGKPVRGIIIAQTISKKIQYALLDVPNVELREYELALALHLVPPLGGTGGG